MSETPKWTPADEAMRWLNEVETAQGGANGPTIKLRAALLALIADGNKSERRAIVFGDIVNSHVVAMRAAVVAAKLEGLDVGMQWIANTLCGPVTCPTWTRPAPLAVHRRCGTRKPQNTRHSGRLTPRLGPSARLSG